MKIVLAEKVSPATLAVFAAEPGWEVMTHDQLPEGLPAALADADALVVRSAVQVDDALMEHAPKLRVIGRAGVGVDNIDADAATRRGIVVMNTPGANAVAVAELTIGLMIALARKVPAANATMHAGKWEKKSLQGAELRGKTLGILGLGRIGLEVAQARARVRHGDRRQRSVCLGRGGARERHRAGSAWKSCLRKCGLPHAARGPDAADHGHHQRQDAGGDEEGRAHHQLRARRAGGGCGAGGGAQERAGGRRGAGCVLPSSRRRIRRISELDNVILTPHIAGSTAEAQEAVGMQIAHQVREYLKLGVVQNAVNLPSLSHEEYVQLAPYIDLAGRLGSFLAQAGKGGANQGLRPFTWSTAARWPRPRPSWCATRPSRGCCRARRM